MQILGDHDAQRAQHNPNHEADIEIEKGRHKRGRMPGARNPQVMGLAFKLGVERRQTFSLGASRH